jgi:glycosyltransferase involved in cell wall biosynthesis
VSTPKISVITSTWQRHDLLLERCIPSIQAQAHPGIEHIIVSDGPDSPLEDALKTRRHDLITAFGYRTWYFELPEHDPAEHWGTQARLHGLEYASGDLIAYCDDDDSLRPEHCALLAAALADNPDAGWASSVMASHHPSGAVTDIGFGPPSIGNLGTPMIMHRREILKHGTWGSPSMFEDWDFVNQWNLADVKHVKVEKVTCDTWPSAYRWWQKKDKP